MKISSQKNNIDTLYVVFLWRKKPKKKNLVLPSINIFQQFMMIIMRSAVRDIDYDTQSLLTSFKTQHQFGSGEREAG